jgi:hypothetical protein
MRPGRWESRARRDGHWQQLDKHVSVATDMHATTDELLEVVLFMQSVKGT